MAAWLMGLRNNKEQKKVKQEIVGVEIRVRETDGAQIMYSPEN